MGYWTKTSFWNKIKDSIQIVGTFTQLSLIFGESQHVYNVAVALIQLSGMLLPIWLVDTDGDGQIDGFEKEITTVTTIKSDSPIEVQTETTKTKTP